MKKYIKIASLMLALFCVFSLVSCASQKGTDTDTVGSDTEADTAEAAQLETAKDPMTPYVDADASKICENFALPEANFTFEEDKMTADEGNYSRTVSYPLISQNGITLDSLSAITVNREIELSNEMKGDSLATNNMTFVTNRMCPCAAYGNIISYVTESYFSNENLNVFVDFIRGSVFNIETHEFYSFDDIIKDVDAYESAIKDGKFFMASDSETKSDTSFFIVNKEMSKDTQPSVWFDAECLNVTAAIKTTASANEVIRIPIADALEFLNEECPAAAPFFENNGGQ